MSTQLGDPELLEQLAHFENKVKYATDLAELYFITCNSIKTIVSIHQAFFWQKNYYGSPRIQASSGIASIDPNAPMILFLQEVIDCAMQKQEKPEIAILEKKDFSEKIAQEWNEWLPDQVMWCPLLSSSKDKILIGGLILTSETPWSNTDIQLVQVLSNSISCSLSLFLHKRGKKYFFSTWPKKVVISVVLTSIVLLLLLPIHQTVLAPAEIVAEDPVVVTSSLNEVIDHVYVTPNQVIKKGDKLLSVDKTELDSSFGLAKREYQEAIEKLRSASQFSFENDESHTKLALLRIDVEKYKLKMQYHAELLDNATILAPRDGVVIFSDASDLIGKPVKVGEKVMEIADPNKKRLKMVLPVGDAIHLKLNSDIKFYLNTDPLEVIQAKLSYASYSAYIQPNGFYAYILKGDFTKDQAVPRIGLRGTAKIYGEKVSLFYYLLRKPCAAIRQRFGI